MRIMPRRMVSYSVEEFRTVLGAAFSKTDDTDIVRFEQEFAAYMNSPHAVGVSSIREGLSRLVDLMKFPEGSEIILCAYNYHVIPLLLKQKKLVPVFVDIDPDTLNIDESLIEEKISDKTVAVIVTHLFGTSANSEAIAELCTQHQLKMIEDAAHSCGAERAGQKIGTFGDYGLFSFGTGKPLVTLGGGMIVGRDEQILTELKQGMAQSEAAGGRSSGVGYFVKCLIQIILTNRILFAVLIYPPLLILQLFGWDAIERLTGDKYTKADISSKSHLSPFSAMQSRLGHLQLKKLDHANVQRVQFARVLQKMLSDVDGIRLFTIHNNRTNIILSFNTVVKDVVGFRKHLLMRGIDTRESSMRNCAQLLGCSGEYPALKEVDDQIVELPCSHLLSIKDIHYIGNTVRKYFGCENVFPDEESIE